jgi:hypothetical protein
MSDRTKITLIWVTLISVLGIAAYIRNTAWPPEPAQRRVDPWEQEAESATPECAQLIRAERALLDKEDSTENARNKAFSNEEARIENSDASEDEKEIARQKLAQRDDLRESKEEGDSTIAFMKLQQELKSAGCLQRK